MNIYNISKYAPEGWLRDKARAWFHNRKSNREYKIKYRKGLFVYTFKDGTEIKSIKSLGQDFNLVQDGYLQHYALMEGDIVIDAGAYHGVFCMYASQIIGKTGRVYAFEPEEKNFNILVKNLQLSNITNVIPIKKGLWDKEGMLTISDDKVSSSFLKEGTQKVEVTDLDSEIVRRRIQKVDFIKMDIEGAEVEALKGMQKTLKRDGVCLAIASYHLRDNIQTREFCEKFLTKRGYTAFSGYPIHLTTYGAKLW